MPAIWSKQWLSLSAAAAVAVRIWLRQAVRILQVSIRHLRLVQKNWKSSFTNCLWKKLKNYLLFLWRRCFLSDFSFSVTNTQRTWRLIMHHRSIHRLWIRAAAVQETMIRHQEMPEVCRWNIWFRIWRIKIILLPLTLQQQVISFVSSRYLRKLMTVRTRVLISAMIFSM